MPDASGLATLPGLVQWLIVLAAIATAAYTLWRRVGRPIARAALTIHKTYEKVMEYDDRLGVVESRSKELVNNSGSSLRDAVDRIEFNQNAQAAALADHVEWGRNELLKVWQNLASRDAVEAAARTAEMLDHKS